MYVCIAHRALYCYIYLIFESQQDLGFCDAQLNQIVKSLRDTVASQQNDTAKTPHAPTRGFRATF